MTPEAYVFQVLRCQRASWPSHSVRLRRGGFRPVDTVESGYVIRMTWGGKMVLLPDAVLKDKIAVARLAMRSTPSRMRGWMVRDSNDVRLEGQAAEQKGG